MAIFSLYLKGDFVDLFFEKFKSKNSKKPNSGKYFLDKIAF